MTLESHAQHDYIEYAGTDRIPCRTLLPTELNIPLSVNGVDWLTFHCSPCDLSELATGYLYNEAFIKNYGEVKSVTINDKPHIDIWLSHSIKRPEQWHRTSGCQGGMIIGEAPPQKLSPKNPYRITALYNMVAEFHEDLAKTKPQLRGLHTSSFYNDGNLVIQYSDIGRHNTLDKIAGWMIRQKGSYRAPLILTSGRLTSEMVTKCVRMGIPAVISLHSATTAAIQVAETTGVMLAGHAKPKQLGIFTHSEMIL
jgi:FdhD protein